MAGLSGGFDGKYGSLKNVPTLPEGVSLNDYRSSENRTYSRQGEQDFEIGLTQIGYPDGMYDVFVDSSKVSSTTDISVTTGTDGFVELDSGSSTANLDGTTSTQTDTAAAGIIINPNTDLTSITVTTDKNIADCTRVAVTDTNENILASKTGTYNGGEDVTLQASLTSGTDYYVVVDAEGDSHTWANQGSPTFPYTSTHIDAVGGVTQVFSGASESTSFWRQVRDIKGSYQKTDGSITSTTQDKGYSATQATLTADYVLNGQSIDSIDLFDGADNLLASWTETEIGSSKSITTSRTDYYAKINLSSDGTDTPKVNKYEMGLDN